MIYKIFYSNSEDKGSSTSIIVRSKNSQYKEVLSVWANYAAI